MRQRLVSVNEEGEGLGDIDRCRAWHGREDLFPEPLDTNIISIQRRCTILLYFHAGRLLGWWMSPTLLHTWRKRSAWTGMDWHALVTYPHPIWRCITITSSGWCMPTHGRHVTLNGCHHTTRTLGVYLTPDTHTIPVTCFILSSTHAGARPHTPTSITKTSNKDLS